MSKRAGSLGHLLNELMLRVGSAGARSALAVVQESGLTLPQMIVLQELHQHGEQPVSRLAEAIGLSMSATSVVVQRLVEQDLATRHEDPIDRRQRLVAITRTGAAIVDEMVGERATAFDDGFAAVPAAMRAELTDVLTRVLAQLRTAPRRAS
ncbi:MAG: MarR family transcriptional regulator [Kofleriaceae bacterium]|nr:MarR family transcriptional regulator [Kofleriaceae bacterium]